MAQRVSFDLTPEAEASKLQFLRRQFCVSPAPISRHDVDLAGKTAIVTGANCGLGFECSRQLLELGLTKLILAVRDETKGEAARDLLMADVKPDTSQTIEVWKLDYASYDSILAFAQRAEQLSPRLDIAILNAGVSRASFSLNPATGHEENIQTNYLSSVLLLLLLVRIYKRAASTTDASHPAPGRIVLVSSDTAAWAKFAERNKQPLLPAFDTKEAKFDRIERYATTKLLGQLFVAELAKRVPSSQVVVNCANPGLCYTNLQRDVGLSTDIATRILGRSAANGARALLHAAVKQDETSHGQFVGDGKIKAMAPFVYSEQAAPVAQRLWDETLRELEFAGVHDALGSPIHD
ncbi:NAD(P)-binding protein [Xylaria intraflava]|nr:NAD(P)-binding protein [Xylaria intraflava]